MEDILKAIIIAIVQGITEWIPVSSSGHITLFENLLDYKQGLMFDVALHFGTLMAVFVYFGKDIVDIVEEFLRLNFKSEKGKLGIYLIIGTIPAGIVGYLFYDLFDSLFNDLKIAAFGFAITGLLLFIASIDIGKGKDKIGFRESIGIGIAQVFSLLPGVSRSGITLSSGLLLGLDEKTALKFSFLLSIPVIFGANVLTIGNGKMPSDFLWATLVSFVVGLIMIHLLYRYVLTTKKNLRWFGAYALLLSIVIFSYLYLF